MSTTPEQPTQLAWRLSPNQLVLLEKKFPQITVPRSELEAGYLLGVQAVFKQLRDGFSG